MQKLLTTEWCEMSKQNVMSREFQFVHNSASSFENFQLESYQQLKLEV